MKGRLFRASVQYEVVYFLESGESPLSTKPPLIHCLNIQTMNWIYLSTFCASGVFFLFI